MDRPPDASSDSPDSLPCTAVLDAVGEGVIQLDPDGYVVTLNETLAVLAGRDREAVIGEHVSRFLDAETLAHAQAAIRSKLLDGETETLAPTIPVYTATDDVVPCEVRLSAVFDGGDFAGTVGVVREIEDPEDAAEVSETSDYRQAFDALAQASADGIIMLDDKSVIRYANPAVERILGYAPAELVGNSKMQIIPERLRDAHADALQRYLDTGEKHIDWTYVELPGRHKDGHEVPLAISLNEFEYGGQHYFVGTFRDISQRKQTERERQESEQRYRALVEATTKIVWRTNADGEFATEQPDWGDFTGQQFEEYEGMGWLDAIHPEDRDRVRTQWTAAVQAADPVRFKYRLGRRDGTWRWFQVRAAPVVEDDGRVREWIGAHTDITARKEYEQALAALQEVSHDLLDATTREDVSRIVVDAVVNVLDIPAVGIYLYDADAEVLEPVATSQYVDEVFSDLASFSAGDSAITWQTFVDGETMTFDDVRETDLTYTGKTPLRSGTWIPLDDHGVLAVISTEVGAFDGDALQLADLLAATAEAALKRTDRERRLQHQNDRLESFASMLAHELRNPVTIGQIYSQQLPDGTDSEAVGYVAEAFDRIEDMVDVMLVLTRGRRAVGERTPVELAAVAREAWDEVDAPDATLEVGVDRTIQADETYVRHLFRNLFENAAEHGGADVTVTVGELPSGFYVADDGVGIPAAERDAVFETGYTTASSNGGTGLGLAFVQELAGVYDWDCAVTESAAGGARFEFAGVDPV